MWPGFGRATKRAKFWAENWQIQTVVTSRRFIRILSNFQFRVWVIISLLIKNCVRVICSLIAFNSKNALEKFSYCVEARVHWESKLTAAKEKIILSPQSKHNSNMFSKCKVSSHCIKRIFPTISFGRCVRDWDPKIENRKGGFEITAKRTGHPTKRRTGSAPDTKRRTSTFQRFSKGFQVSSYRRSATTFTSVAVWKFESNEGIRSE